MRRDASPTPAQRVIAAVNQDCRFCDINRRVRLYGRALKRRVLGTETNDAERICDRGMFERVYLMGAVPIWIRQRMKLMATLIYKICYINIYYTDM